MGNQINNRLFGRRKLRVFNQTIGENEQPLLLEKQDFESDDMYKIELKNGNEMKVSEEHMVYAGIYSKMFINSSVVNTLTESCCFKWLSFDQIGSLRSNERARYGTSFSSTNSLNCLNKWENSDSLIKDICCFNDSNISFNDLLDFVSISDLYFANSPNANEGENNFILCNLTRQEAEVLGFTKENKIFASATSFIYSNLSFLSFSAPSFLTFLPSSIAQSVNPDSFSSFSLTNKSCLKESCLTLSSINLRINTDHFTSGKSLILLRNSSGTDKVILTIVNSSNYVSKHNYVGIYKSIGFGDFKLHQVRESYSSIGLKSTKIANSLKESIKSLSFVTKTLCFNLLDKNENIENFGNVCNNKEKERLQIVIRTAGIFFQEYNTFINNIYKISDVYI